MVACEGGPSAVVRIACIGDSLTAGDNLHAFRAGSVKRCNIVDPLCRGNYPLDLADLLSGSTTFAPRAAGQSARI